ncbi:MAG: ABC transporter permease [Saccharofermentanales bacterium]|jgi:peptide/nickel transport system permease protein
MLKYIAKNAAQMLVTLLLIVLIVFIMFELIPGNPAQIMSKLDADQKTIEALEQEFGIHDPLPVKISKYFTGLLNGDMGRSIRFGKPVIDLIRQAIPVTMSLAIYSFFLIVIISVPLALLASVKRGSFIDNAIRFTTETTLAIPPFFMAVILMLIFRTTQLGLKSGQGASSGSSVLVQYLLPALAIALSRVTMALEFLRDSIIEQKKMFYLKTAIGKGVTRSRIILTHVLRNSLVPYITVLGLIIAEIFGGSIIIEQVFLLPGLGRLLVTAVESRDFPLTQGIIITIAIVVIVVNFLVDLINQFIDPRLREKEHVALRTGLGAKLIYKLNTIRGVKK